MEKLTRFHAMLYDDLVHHPLAIFNNLIFSTFDICPSSQAAMFSAMLSSMSSVQAQEGGRSLLDCAAQAGHTQARSLGLASLTGSNSGEP